jgi:rhodanese-related sulfurtransferase
MKSIQPEFYLSPLQVKDYHLNGALIIDVREAFEFADKGIDLPNVFNFPLSTLKENHKQIPEKKTLIVVCTVGFCSDKAAKILINNGFKQVFILQGGLLNWSDEGLAMYTNPENIPDDITPHQCNCS